MKYAVVFAALMVFASVVYAEDALSVRCVAFSPDGKLLAVSTGEAKQKGSVILWDVASRKHLWEHTENTGVPAIAFSPVAQEQMRRF